MAIEVAIDNDRWKQERARRLTIEAALRAEHEAKTLTTANTLIVQQKLRLAAVEAQRTIDRDACLQRSELFVNLVLRTAREGGGNAVECSTCYLLSPPDAQSCPYCVSGTSSSMHTFTLSAEYAATIHHRIRSSLKPNRSVQATPIMQTQQEQSD